MSFINIYHTDFRALSNPGFIFYGVGGILVIFLTVFLLLPKWIREKPTAASFGQALLRPNYIIFGSAVAQSIYGEGNIALVFLMGAVVIPVYNVFSTILLERWQERKSTPTQLFISIMKNPMILSTFLGIAVNLSGIPIPSLILAVMEDVGGLTTPISFLSIGVGLSLSAGGKRFLALMAAAWRLILIPLVFVVGGILLGFRGIELCALMILFASPAAVSSYPTAVAMGADGELAGQIVALTTLLCLPTIFLWTFVLNLLQLL